MGVTIFSILYVLVGLLSLLPMPLFSLLYFITGVGVFLLKPFARYLAITTSILGIVVNTIKIPDLLNGTLHREYGQGVVLVLGFTYLVHLGVIYFFTRPMVKAQFQKG